MAKYYVITDKFKLVEVTDAFLSVTGDVTDAFFATRGDSAEDSKVMNLPMTVMKGDAFKTYLLQNDMSTAWTEGDFTVYMDGVDVTDDVCTILDDDYVVEINIPEVTGDIYIVAVGEPVSVE